MTNITVEYKEKLTPEELHLINEIKKPGVDYKIDPGTDSGIVYVQNGKITGFMTVDCFGGDEIEAAAIAVNKTIWEEMNEVLLRTAKKKHAKQILYICSPSDKNITELLKQKELKYGFSEYRMTFNEKAFSPILSNDVTLTSASESDIPYIKKLDIESFGGDVFPNEYKKTQIITMDGNPVGKLRIHESNDLYGIYGVVIESEHRGKGIGGKALSLLLRTLINKGAKNIYLEVDSENPAAFHLYKKLGFEIASEFCYYQGAIGDII